MKTGFLGAIALSLALTVTADAALTTNSWVFANPNGKWEDGGHWSLGAPAPSNGADIITNATTKTITIDAATTNTPTMTISNLTLSAPGTDVNTLQLTNAGTATPLTVLNLLEIGGGGAMLVSGSRVVNTNSVCQLHVGSTGAGQMTVSNGTVLANQVYAGLFSPGTMTWVNATNTFAIFGVGAVAGSTGTVWMTGGLLSLTANTIASSVGNFGVGAMTVSNGTVQCFEVDVGRFAGAQGTLTMAGGTNTMSGPLIIGNVVNSTGAVWVTGGQLTVTNAAITVGNGGVAQMTISNGLLQASGNCSVGAVPGAPGTLTLAGGTNTFSAILSVGNTANATGAVWVTGGQIVATNSTSRTIIGNLGSGQMTVSNGTVLARQVDLALNGGAGTLTIAGGTNILTGALSLGVPVLDVGTVWVTGGLLVVTNATTTVGSNGVGSLTISNGTWLAQTLSVGATHGVVISGQGTVTVAGGTSHVYGNTVLGTFDCTATGSVVVAGGQLFFTNAAHNAVLDVRSGALELSSGTLVIDQLVITNACGHFIHEAGAGILFQNNPPILGAGMDADGDGIPNGYEKSHGLDQFDPADAALDSDGDGLSNLQEYLVGTDPTNGASAFRITSALRTNNDVRITWMMGTGKTNALERSSGTADGSYSNNFVAIFTITNTVGTTTNYLDVGGATNVPSLYYRVRLVP